MSGRVLPEEIYLLSLDSSFNGMGPIDEDRKKFLDNSYRSYAFFSLRRTTLLVVALNRMKIGRNLWFGKQEREMGTPLRDATEQVAIAARSTWNIHVRVSR